MNDATDIEHSERGPSTASRWRKCPGSVALSRGLPSTAGFDAAQGTVFHEFAALCLITGCDPFGFIGEKLPVEGHGRVEFDREMADNMVAGLDIVWALMDMPGVKVIVEKKVSLHNWIGPGEFGTTDCTIVDPANMRMFVWDWKYGAGVPVSPVENDQAILYALGAWDDFGRDAILDYLYADAEAKGQVFDDSAVPWEDSVEVNLMIEQPRAPGGGGTWTTTIAELLRIGRQIRKDADRTLEPNAPLVPGPDQCKFCKAAKAGICEARARMAVTEAGLDFDMIAEDFEAGRPSEITRATDVTPEQRTQILLHRAMIEQFLQELHNRAVADLRAGRKAPGLKLVEGRRPARKWIDEKKAELLVVHDLGEKDAFTRRLLSPTQVEGKVGKKTYKTRFGKLVDMGEPGTELVPDTDKREAIPDVNRDFDTIEETAIDDMI